MIHDLARGAINLNKCKTVEGLAAPAHAVVRAGNVEQERSEGIDRAIRRGWLAFVQEGEIRLYSYTSALLLLSTHRNFRKQNL